MEAKGTTQTITFEGKEYPYQKEGAAWSVTLKKAEVRVRQADELILMTLSHDLLVPLTIDWQEDEVRFLYTIPQDALSFREIQALPQVDKLRAALNARQVQQLLDLPVVFFMDPENIVFDRNLLPKIVHRGLKGKMEPEHFQEEMLLRQYKAFVLALFEEKASFRDLYEGQIDLQTKNDFVQKIQAGTTFEEVETYLNHLYQEKARYTHEKTRTVTKRQFTVYQQLAIWMSVLVLLLLLPLGYLALYKVPFQTKMAEADQAFFKSDYDGVLTTLNDVKITKLPTAQKYIGAYSVVETASLSDKQKTAILAKLSVNGNEATLTYWNQIGRGDFEDALDNAKGLQDADLTLYAITQRIEQIRSSTKMSGSEKEEAINKLQEDYKKYDEERQAAISGDDEESTSSSSTATSSTTKSTTSSTKGEHK